MYKIMDKDEIQFITNTAKLYIENLENAGESHAMDEIDDAIFYFIKSNNDIYPDHSKMQEVFETAIWNVIDNLQN